MDNDNDRDKVFFMLFLGRFEPFYKEMFVKGANADKRKVAMSVGVDSDKFVVMK